MAEEMMSSGEVSGEAPAENAGPITPTQITPQAFAAKIKEKYPAYKDVDDMVLAQKMVEKYPEYKSQVNFAQPKPTQPVGKPQAVGQNGVSASPSATMGKSSSVFTEPTLGRLPSGAVPKKDISEKATAYIGQQPTAEDKNKARLQGIADAIKKLNTPLKSEEKKSALANMWDNFEADVVNVDAMLASIPEGLYTIGALPQNAFAALTGLKQFETSAEKHKKFLGVSNPILDHYLEESKKINEKTTKYEQEHFEKQGVWNSLTEGNWGDAFEQMGIGLARSAPTSIAMMVGGASTSLPKLIGGSTVAMTDSKMRELEETHPHASEAVKTVKALGLAGAETVFEGITDGTLGKVYKSILAKEGEEAGKVIFKEGLVKMYETAVKKYGAKAAALGGAIEEVATNATQNLIKGKPAMEGWQDAAILGLAGEGAMAAPINVAQVANKFKTAAQERQINKVLESDTNEYNTIQDVFNPTKHIQGGELNLDKLKIVQAKGVSEMLTKSLDRSVEKGEMTEIEAQGIKKDFLDTASSVSKTAAIPFSEENRLKATNLIRQKEQLKTEVSNMDEALAIPKKEQIKKIDEQLLNLANEATNKPTQPVEAKAEGETQGVPTTSEATGKENVREEVGETPTEVKPVEETAQVEPTTEATPTEPQATAEPQVEQTTAKISEDTKTALDSGKTKQVEIVDENGETKIEDVEFTKADADTELNNLETLAKENKLTPEEFNKSYFSQHIDTPTLDAAYEKIKTDPVSFVSDLRNAYEAAPIAETAPTTEAPQVYKEKAKATADKIRSLKANPDIKTAMSKLSSSPVPLFEAAWDGALEATARAVETSGDIAQAINDGVKHLKTTDWYKGLSNQGQVEAEKMFRDNMIAENPIQETIDSEEETGFKVRKLISGVTLLSYVDDVFYKKVTSKIDTNTANFVKKALDSNNTIVRNIGEIATSWFNGLPRTKEELTLKRQMKGKQESAFIAGEKLTKSLQQLINFSEESASRVHKVLDPELYDEADQITYDDLNSEEKQLHDILRDLNDKTHELNYKEGFISEKTYEEFKDKYIARAYEEFEKTGGDDQGDEGEFVDTRIDTSIFKQRKEIDQWKIDNKVTDPIYLTVNRMIRTQRNMAIKSYADMIAGDSKLSSDTEKKGYVKLDGKRYGSLNGKFVPQYLAEDFKGYYFANKYLDLIYNGLQGYDKIKVRQFLKKFHTVYSPLVQVGNFVSNHAFAFATGVNVAELWGNIPAAKESLKTKDADYIELVENGIIGSSVLMSDITPLTKPAQEKLKLQQAEETKGFKAKIKKGLTEADKKAQELYSTSDDLMKLAAYKALKKAGYSKSESVNKIFDGFQNYATVGKMWDAASKTPVIGNAYIKFQADLMRIMKNAAIKKPLTTATFLGAIKLMSMIASDLSGEDDEKKKIREGRSFIPKINLGFTDIPLVFKVGGKEVNVARYLSPYYEYDVPNKDWLSSMSRFMPFQFEYTEGKEMGQESVSIETPDVLLGGLTQAFIQNRDFRNKSISDPYSTRYKESGLSDSEKIMNKLNYVSRSVIPLYATAQDTYMSYQFGEDYYGRSKSVSDNFLSKVIKVETFGDKEVEKEINNRIKGFDYEQKGANAKLKAIESKYIKDITDISNKVDEGTLSSEKASRKTEKIEAEYEKRYSKQLEELVRIQEELNEFLDSSAKVNLNY